MIIKSNKKSYIEEDKRFCLKFCSLTKNDKDLNMSHHFVFFQIS